MRTASTRTHARTHTHTHTHTHTNTHTHRLLHVGGPSRRDRHRHRVTAKHMSGIGVGPVYPSLSESIRVFPSLPQSESPGLLICVPIDLFPSVFPSLFPSLILEVLPSLYAFPSCLHSHFLNAIPSPLRTRGTYLKSTYCTVVYSVCTPPIRVNTALSPSESPFGPFIRVTCSAAHPSHHILAQHPSPCRAVRT